MEQGRIGMIHLPSRRTDGSSLSSYRYSHPPPPPTRNSMNQPSSLLGVLNIGPAPCFSAGLGYYHPLKTRPAFFDPPQVRSEEHTSELQSLMRISYAVFCLKKKKQNIEHNKSYQT